MSEDSGAIFQVGDEVIWWKQIPGGDYAYPVLATVLKITAKRVQIEGDDDGRIVKRYVVAANLEKTGRFAAGPTIHGETGAVSGLHLQLHGDQRPPAQ